MDHSPERPAIPPRPEEDPADRRSGLLMETCYRHPDRITGVHCTRCGRPICPDCMTAAPVGYQCPACVAEVRKSHPGRRFHVQFILGRPGIVTTTLLALNIGMFLVEVVSGGPGALLSGPNNQKLFDLGALYPPAIAVDHQYWRLLSAMFLHAGLFHIFFNMYALYLFGYLIERALGKVRFILLYLLTGFLASVVSFAFGPLREVGVGASGAIFGLLGAWVAFNYRRRQSPVAAAQLRWAYILIGINLVLSFSIPGIDWRAHVGGLAAGIVAGTLAEGVGPGKTRLALQVVGFAVLLGLGIGLAAWRVATFPAA
jgi:membrane associated rhomboid family serine protease